MSTRISIIVATDEKRGIGKDNDLLFKIPEDFIRMKALTTGHPIIMGKKTFDSIGRVLPKRTNIVVSRDTELRIEGALVAHSLEDAIAQAKVKEGADEIFIFGGGQLFKESLQKDLVDRIYLTLVEGDFNADTFFPDYSKFTKEIEKEEKESEWYHYTFLTLEK